MLAFAVGSEAKLGTRGECWAISAVVVLAMVIVGGCPGPAAGVSSGRQVIPSTERTGGASAVIDFTGVDAWLKCAQTAGNLSECENASAVTQGGRIAKLAMVTFGDETPPPAQPRAEAVHELVSRMKHWPNAIARAARFLPARPESGTYRVFVVANGHPWGDAYVRGIVGEGNNVRLSDSGEPVIIFNAALIASGGGTFEEQADGAFGIFAHELFHALFHKYGKMNPAWARLLADTSPSTALQVIVLNEGVAHFVDREKEFLATGFPRERGEAALMGLAHAVLRLKLAGASEAEDLLRAANQGRYWDKFGAISGMLFAHGVFRAFGLDGVREGALRGS